MNIQLINYKRSSNNHEIKSDVIRKQTRQPIILALIVVIALTLAQALGIKPLVAVVLLMYLLVFIRANSSDVIPLILFFLPWSPLLKLAPGSIAFSSIATLIVGVKLCKNNILKIPKLSLIASIAILVVTVFSKLFNGYVFSSDYLMFFMMIVIFPCLVHDLRESTNFEFCTVCFAVGIISATLVSLLFINSSNIAVYIESFQFYNSTTVRLCGFYGDPNFFAAQIVSAIGCLLLIIRNNKHKSPIFVIMLVLLVCCGLLSVSKSFIIATALVFILFLVALFVNQDLRLIKMMACCVILVALIFATNIFSSQIDMLISRLTFTGDMSSFTTGRTDLWLSYISFFIHNPLDFLVGQGYTSVFNGVPKGSHNTLLQVIYQFGIVGSLFLILWIFSFKNSYKGVKKMDLALLLFALFFTWFGVDMMYFDDFFITIVLLSVATDYLTQTRGIKNDS